MKQEFPFYKPYEKGKRINKTAKAEGSLSLEDKELIEKFCLYCSANSKGEKRADNIKRVMIQFCDFLEKPLNQLKDEDFIFFAQAINKSSRTTISRNEVRAVIKRFGNWLNEKKGKKFNNLKLIKSEKTQGTNKIQDSKDLITELEFDKLLKATNNLMHKTLICMLWESAGRPEEILKLRWNDIDFIKGNVKLHSSKTGSIRIIPLDVTIQHLKRLKEESNINESDLIFSSQKQGKELDNSSFNFILKNLCNKAGIKKNISGYTFRHTRLSQLIKTLSPKSYEMFAGHSLEMGMHTYAHLNIDDLSKEMKDKVFAVKELTAKDKEEMKELKKEIETLRKMIIDTRKEFVLKLPEVQQQALQNIYEVMEETGNQAQLYKDHEGIVHLNIKK